jgi:hypothetical protein
MAARVQAGIVSEADLEPAAEEQEEEQATA